jgi:hypothetical protein
MMDTSSVTINESLSTASNPTLRSAGLITCVPGTNVIVDTKAYAVRQGRQRSVPGVFAHPTEESDQVF